MNSVLVIDKPQGITSHDVVARVRRIVGERSIGHLGTLDPMATGVLPLLTGKFTRLSQFFMLNDKEYEGSIRFGWTTDTYDAEGAPTSDERSLQLSLDELDRLADRFRGEIWQVPPAYSAKKIAGVPSYKSARKGQAAVLDAVRVQVHEFRLMSLEQNSLGFAANVSSGTYIRSLAHELGELAGCGAHLAELRRTSVGDFSLQQALTLDQLEHHVSTGEPIGIHPRHILPEIPAVTADDTALAKIRHGNSVNLPEFSRAKLVKVFRGPSELVAVASRIAGTLFQPKIVLI